MVRALAPYQERHDLDLTLVDVDEDPVLAARFGERVPVLADGEQVLCEYFLKDAELTAHLGQPRHAPASIRGATRNARIHAIARQIPAGRVATYGQIAAIEGHSTPRMVGNAMANLPRGSDVPWQRVLNARGTLSPRAGGGGTEAQHARLRAEGVLFDAGGRVDFRQVGWDGPDARWLRDNDCRAAPRAGVPVRRAGNATSAAPAASDRRRRNLKEHS
jgi:methylated-DNA-protein-cysteine methyltransferase-like protein